jgi:ubiquinone/menaquinone biosynthesis C-methylase UbiE
MVSQMDMMNKYQKRINFYLSCINIHKDGRTLFLGCGSGFEPLCFKRTNPHAFAVGMDIDRKVFSHSVKGKMDLIVCTAEHLPFIDNGFHHCYCYHVLEHVTDLAGCIKEIGRVTRLGLFVATPNAQRIIGYLISAEPTSLYDFFTWNLKELFQRLNGTFRQRHAGFTETELHTALAGAFDKINVLSDSYNRFIVKNTKYELIVMVLSKLKISRIISPSLTFFCEKR